MTELEQMQQALEDPIFNVLVGVCFFIILVVPFLAIYFRREL